MSFIIYAITKTQYEASLSLYQLLAFDMVKSFASRLRILVMFLNSLKF